MKVALVHDYLTQPGGAERVFELLCKHYPNADIFTSLYDPEKTINLGDREVRTTVLQKVPGASKNFRLMAPFYFSAFRALDLQDYDLIISSTTSFAKAVRKKPGAKHICFCHNVTRFLWDTNTYLRDYATYRNMAGMLGPIFKQMRKADLDSAQEPDFYIANSSTVASRIQQFYGKQSVVINYPIDIKKFIFSKDKEDFYLTSARLLGYKRIDIIIEAFNWLGWPLLITGDGPERERLESRALKNIKFLGHVKDEKRSRLMSKARGMIVAALEDYGLVPVEANASGTPVIAYGKGGVLDTQIPGETGLFFNEQAPQSLQEALIKSRKIAWDYEKIRDHAIGNFSEDAFFKKVDKVIREVCGYHQP
ncbi:MULTISPECIES: glycosyltransferase [unclassified Microcoleus]|uniref:glycosyltransferase n=1 Tax=unclassified Microcoleus TaxID=2642155 RepID=UPI002FD58E00